MKPNYGTFWSEENETEMIVQFHLQTPDIPLVAESETVILNYDIFIVDLTLLRYKFEKIQDNNLPKIEKIQGKKLKGGMKLY